MAWPAFLRVGIFFLALAGGGEVWAQLDVRLETPKSSYLQFAELPFTLQLRNLGAGTIQLEERNGQPWLELLVQSNDGQLIQPDRPYAPPSLTVASGQTRALALDLAPYFLVREVGGYKARASVRLESGETLLTEPLPFLIGRGEVIWTTPRGEGKERRIFSLVKFYEDPNVGLYLRVEVPEQNLVYPARRLGPFMPLGKPMAEFDSKNHLHLLYAVAPGQHRITVVNQDGQVLREENRQETVAKPRLRRSPDGLVDVDGGSVILPSHLREKLSTLQSRAATISVTR